MSKSPLSGFRGISLLIKARGVLCEVQTRCYARLLSAFNICLTVHL